MLLNETLPPHNFASSSEQATRKPWSAPREFRSKKRSMFNTSKPITRSRHRNCSIKPKIIRCSKREREVDCNERMGGLPVTSTQLRVCTERWSTSSSNSILDRFSRYGYPSGSHYSQRTRREAGKFIDDPISGMFVQGASKDNIRRQRESMNLPTETCKTNDATNTWGLTVAHRSLNG